MACNVSQYGMSLFGRDINQLFYHSEGTIITCTHLWKSKNRILNFGLFSQTSITLMLIHFKLIYCAYAAYIQVSLIYKLLLLFNVFFSFIHNWLHNNLSVAVGYQF